MMVFNKTNILRFLSSLAVLSAGIVFSACFEVPDAPNESQSVNRISVYVEQGGKIDSTLLKIHPYESAEICAVAHPDDFSENLKFGWYREGVDSLFGDEPKFSIRKNASGDMLPNMLVATDPQGNSLVSRFEIVINSPPEIDSVVSPQPSDTLYGNENTSFLFEWESHDRDDENFTHTILIDDEPYVVGDFNSVRQSGFEEGEHTFQVVVTDNYGDSDSSAVIEFFVKEKRGK